LTQPQHIGFPRYCPSDDNEIDIPAGKGVQIYGARMMGEVVVRAVEYDRGKGWEWDGIQWDGVDAIPKPYLLQHPKALDAFPDNGVLKLRISARYKPNNKEACANSVLKGTEPHPVPAVGGIVLQPPLQSGAVTVNIDNNDTTGMVLWYPLR
jgi:hypothetical protein